VPGLAKARAAERQHGVVDELLDVKFGARKGADDIADGDVDAVRVGS